MSRNGKRYTEEFKHQIINLYPAGKPIAELAKEYGLAKQTIYRWKRLYIQLTDSNAEQSISLKDYKKLQKKIRQLEIENEILKKATAIFSRKQ